MTDETRILRTVGIPLVIGIVLLVMVPKMCVKAVQVSKARQEKAAAREPGFHIESTQKPVSYPAGLDADRIRYLVEIDNRFSAPYTAHIAKSAGLGDPRVVSALQKLGYVEAGSDGTLALTRDGLLHLEGVIDDGTSWTFPVAKRAFEAVAGIDGDATNANATIAWKWQPNNVGAALLPNPQRHEAKAALTHDATSWTLTGLTVDSDLE